MSRWQIQGTGDYYARYNAYENYLRANAKNLGLSEAQIKEQLGRYAQGLQQKLQYEPQNKIVGSEVAKNPKEFGVGNNPNNVTKELEKTTKQLEVLKQDLGKGATSITYFGTPEQLRNAAPLGNIAPEIPVKSEFQKALEKSQLYKTTKANSVDKLGKRKQKQILEEIEKLGKLAKTDEEINQLKQLTEKFRGGNDQKAFSEAIQKQAENLDKQQAVEHKPAEPKTWQKYAESHGTQYKAPEKFGGIEADKKAQEIIEKAKNPEQKTILGSPEDFGNRIDEERKQKGLAEDVLEDAGKNKSQSEFVDDILEEGGKLKPEAETATKKSKGFMNTIKNAMKGKKGKIALAAGALALVGFGISKCTGGNDEQAEKVENTPKETEQKPETAKPEQPKQEPETVVPQDSIPQDSTVTEEEVPVTATPVEETEPEEDENTQNDKEYTVKEGDSFWNLAKKHLIEAHKDDPDYKPTNKEILELATKFMEDNNYKLDENNYYPDPMLHPGDKLNLAA